MISATPGSVPCSEVSCIGADCVMKLGHHLSAHRRSWCLAVPLFGDQYLDLEGRRRGCRWSRRSCHRRTLVSRVFLRELISKRLRQPLILDADNGNAMHLTKLDSRLEKLGALSSFPKSRASNDNCYAESLFWTSKC